MDNRSMALYRSLQVDAGKKKIIILVGWIGRLAKEPKRVWIESQEIYSKKESWRLGFKEAAVSVAKSTIPDQASTYNICRNPSNSITMDKYKHCILHGLDGLIGEGIVVEKKNHRADLAVNLRIHSRCYRLFCQWWPYIKYLCSVCQIGWGGKSFVPFGGREACVPIQASIRQRICATTVMTMHGYWNHGILVLMMYKYLWHVFMYNTPRFRLHSASNDKKSASGGRA